MQPGYRAANRRSVRVPLDTSSTVLASEVGEVAGLIHGRGERCLLGCLLRLERIQRSLNRCTGVFDGCLGGLLLELLRGAFLGLLGALVALFCRHVRYSLFGGSVMNTNPYYTVFKHKKQIYRGVVRRTRSHLQRLGQRRWLTFTAPYTILKPDIPKTVAVRSNPNLIMLPRIM